MAIISLEVEDERSNDVVDKDEDGDQEREWLRPRSRLRSRPRKRPPGYGNLDWQKIPSFPARGMSRSMKNGKSPPMSLDLELNAPIPPPSNFQARGILQQHAKDDTATLEPDVSPRLDRCKQPESPEKSPQSFQTSKVSLTWQQVRREDTGISPCRLMVLFKQSIRDAPLWLQPADFSQCCVLIPCRYIDSKYWSESWETWRNGGVIGVAMQPQDITDPSVERAKTISKQAYRRGTDQTEETSTENVTRHLLATTGSVISRYISGC